MKPKNGLSPDNLSNGKFKPHGTGLCGYFSPLINYNENELFFSPMSNLAKIVVIMRSPFVWRSKESCFIGYASQREEY